MKKHPHPVYSWKGNGILEGVMDHFHFNNSISTIYKEMVVMKYIPIMCVCVCVTYVIYYI